MAEALRFVVDNWAAWMPGVETRQAWQDWAGQDVSASTSAEPALPAVPMMLRRRLTALGQKLVQVALAATPAATQPRYVLATRHGELDRTIDIFSAVAAGDLPSPADFSVSVHHSLVGLLSIQTANRHGHDAICAGHDSFGCGLLEAALCLAEEPHRPVLLLFSEKPLPEDYATFRAIDEMAWPFALAISLRSAGASANEGVIRFQTAAKCAEERQVASAALDFLRFLLSGMPVMVSAGERMTWSWSRA